jgi:SAM-dependent methyltransferase
MAADPRYLGFPEGFFARFDEAPDTDFYAFPRLVTHIDDDAIAEVGELYRELGLENLEVLDLCSSWVSHFRAKPPRLVALGLNHAELAANPHADAVVVHDLNADPALPLPDTAFDAVVCCVSVDYLVRPIEVFAEVARTLRPGGLFVHTFSNRCFPTKAIAGWLRSDDAGRIAIVREYFRRCGGFGEPHVDVRRMGPGDPLYAVWATRPRR